MNTLNQPATANAPFVYAGLETAVCQQLFCDGFSTVLMSPVTSKVTFYQTVGIADGKEVRREMLTLVLPTVAMLDFSQKFLQNIADNEVPLKTAVEEERQKLFAPRMSPTPPSPTRPTSSQN